MARSKTRKLLYAVAIAVLIFVLIAIAYLLLMQDAQFSGWVSQQCLRVVRSGRFCFGAFPVAE